MPRFRKVTGSVGVGTASSLAIFFFFWVFFSRLFDFVEDDKITFKKHSQSEIFDSQRVHRRPPTGYQSVWRTAVAWLPAPSGWNPEITEGKGLLFLIFFSRSGFDDMWPPEMAYSNWWWSCFS